MKQKETEYIIKEAARQLFQQKGFDGTKTRDIAEAAGINLALLNYYYRSKKKLFNIIMMETFQTFTTSILVIVDDKETSLKEKLSLFIENYIDILTKNPNMVSFILNEIRTNPEPFVEKSQIVQRVKTSVFLEQFQQAIINKTIPPINPLHFLMNLMGLTVFPFIALPVLTTASGIPQENILDIIQERKKLIPLWIDSMLKLKY